MLSVYSIDIIEDENVSFIFSMTLSAFVTFHICPLKRNPKNYLLSIYYNKSRKGAGLES
jgi:hypothetical protein